MRPAPPLYRFPTLPFERADPAGMAVGAHERPDRSREGDVPFDCVVDAAREQEVEAAPLQLAPIEGERQSNLALRLRLDGDIRLGLAAADRRCSYRQPIGEKFHDDSV